jgi:hypothetical protein
MKPITFACQATLYSVPEEIAWQILDLTKWPDFHGHWPIPGIKSAEFEVRTPCVVVLASGSTTWTDRAMLKRLPSGGPISGFD